MKRLTIPAMISLLASVAVLAWAAREETTPLKEATKPAKAPFFGNPLCPITGSKVNHALYVEYKDPQSHTYGKIYMCCPACKAAIEKDAAAIYKKVYLDREIKNKEGKVIIEKGQPIALKNPLCPILGGKVDGKSYLVYNGYRVDFCCPGCDQKFMQDPDKNLAKLIKDQKLTVPGLEKGAKSETKAEGHEHQMKM